MKARKENVNLRNLVENKGQLLATAAGNTLSVDTPYHHLSGLKALKSILSWFKSILALKKIQEEDKFSLAPMSYVISCLHAEAAIYVKIMS